MTQKKHPPKIGKVLLIFFGGFALLFSLMAFAAQPSDNEQKKSSSVTNQGTGALSADHTDFDFGTVSMKNGIVSHAFPLIVGAPVTVTKISTSCMCTKASLVANSKTVGPFGMPGHGFVPTIQESLRSGEQATIDVQFDPNAHGPSGVGRIERVVTVEQEQGAPLELHFSATVTP